MERCRQAFQARDPGITAIECMERCRRVFQARDAAASLGHKNAIKCSEMHGTSHLPFTSAKVYRLHTKNGFDGIQTCR
jgi:hypothetical protein